MGNIIETKSLTKRFAAGDAVCGLDMRVPEGCVYGFMGPNGAGKTTTMKMILGLTHPTSGSIMLMGEAMNEKNRLALLRRTGSLIESPSCYAHLTARENLRVLADLKGVPYRDIERVLKIVGLSGERTRRVGQYSLGMRQRLGIAQALLGSPRLLVLDEPTNGLDPEGIAEMRELIAGIPKNTGATVLISSHLLSELQMIVDYAGIINKGHLLYQGTLERLMSERGGEIIVERRARTLEEIFMELIHEKQGQQTRKEGEA
ncbi:MAG: ABC transporter ATP-binding protein [Clostridia bacterium]|nr:ABC transporter ATP-binding protein [Clostridia bacterium]